MAVRYGKVRQGDIIPYGTLAHASKELRQAYYTFGVVHDCDWQPLPCPPLDVEDTHPDPADVVFVKELSQALANAIDSLPPRQARILTLRYGLGLDRDLTLEEVGRAFDVSRERIRQLEAQALRKLKHPIWYKELRAFINVD